MMRVFLIMKPVVVLKTHIKGKSPILRLAFLFLGPLLWDFKSELRERERKKKIRNKPAASFYGNDIEKKWQQN